MEESLATGVEKDSSAALGMTIYMKKYIKVILRFKYIILLLAITFFAIKPLFHQGFPPTHDGEYHVIRFYEFDKALRDGDLYPRWAPDLNNAYGVPIFNYVYPLPNYFASLFHAFGTSFIDAFKMNLVLATIIGVLFFYFWTRLFFNNIASITAASFYAFAPYRFVDIYIRGSVGEVWGLAFFPAFLWSITSFVQNKRIIYLILASVFLAGTIFSHNILALMFILFGFTYTGFLLALHKWEKRLVFSSLFIFLLGVVLAAVFWLPALAEKSYVQGLQIYNLDANFPELYQLLIPSWGTGFSGDNLQNQMSFQIGVANLIAVFLSLVLLIRYAKKKVENKAILLFFLVWFALVFFLMLSVSKPLWHTVPFLDYFQFPWRFLSLMIIICSFIAGFSINMIKGTKRRLTTSVLFICIAVFTTISYTKPAYYHYRNDDHYTTRNNFIHGTNSPGDVFNTAWINQKLPLKNKKIEIIQGKAKITELHIKTSVISFVIESEGDSNLVANIAYFPGWTLKVDERQSELERTKEGIMKLLIPDGKHMVELKFNDTMIRRVGAGLSLLGIIVCLGLWVLRKRT